MATTSETTPAKNSHATHPHHATATHRKKTSPTKKNKRTPFIVFGAVVLAALILGAIVYVSRKNKQSTDDAFLDAHVVSIGTKVSGLVLAVHVDDNQIVQANDALVDIDPRDFKAQVEQQKALLDSAQADAARAATDAARYRRLSARDEISRQQLDEALSEASKSAAAVEHARAALDQADLNLSYAHIVAPESGRVTKRAVEAGAYVQAGQTLFSLVPDKVFVTANFKETQLTRMRPGQKALIRVDSFPQKKLEGHVDSIQSGTGERFSVMPPENATGNFVKVVQRVPVKIVIDTPPDPAHQLAPGMSVEATVLIQ